MNEIPERSAASPAVPISRPGHSKVTHLSGHVVKLPDTPEEGDIVMHGKYTASTGLEIPITLLTNKSGIIYRLWREELARRNPRKLTVEEDPSQLLADGSPQPRLEGGT